MKKTLLICLHFLLVPLVYSDGDSSSRKMLEELALGRVDSVDDHLNDLVETGDPFIKVFVDAWRVGEIYEYELENAAKVILHRVSEQFELLTSGEALDVPEGREKYLKKSRASRSLRKDLSRITDTIDLASPDLDTRINAALKLGQGQNKDYLPSLRARFERETNEKAKRAFEEAIMISLLKNAEKPEERLGAVVRLGELASLKGRDLVIKIRNKNEIDGDPKLFAAARNSVLKIQKRQSIVENVGSFFRGLSTGSVLLIVAFGLAITFGLMGIINMAHGEFIAIGGYTCYVVQNVFESTFGIQSSVFQWFFWVSLPISFLVAAVIGLVFEKGFIRFLYRRPLESLLATWGLSMVMRQTFRLVFGAANVSVETPSVLNGTSTFGLVSMSDTRLFIVVFAGFVILITWLLLSKTNLGLYIRAVMQNRNMASSLGIPVARVNSLTFAFGCGLASLAGATLSLVSNVGPSMGQTYIVDSFMVVVAGGLGNLIGAGISALGIGVTDQFLQPLLGPVMGKIVVLFAIILFLQWKPGGLFPTKSRSLDD
ncbi:MAG: urea ABC transporter permease subunit UrtB [Opitutales bacterium]|nr:urea ABC transporter permease subunit UrtB [Opitutales bacterium]MBT6381198.1 urea ABC transporter permease subunit UrtB [Opitutales bacterium]MBT7867174.1 urea ABC transporter permease subunit UrtB [Opitutales bacterium]